MSTLTSDQQPQQGSQLTYATRQPPPNPLAKLYGLYTAAHSGYSLGRYGADALSSGASSAAPEAVNASYNIPASYLPSAGADASGTALSEGASQAPTILGSETLANAIPPIAVALEGLRIGKGGLDAFNASKGEGAVKGAQTGFKGKGGIDMLQNLDPFALQARVFGGVLGGLLGHKSTQSYQHDRDNALLKMNDPDVTNFLTQRNTDASKAANYKGRLDPSSAPDFVGQNANGDYVNNKFASSHNVNDLTVNDLTGQDAPIEHYGSQWFNGMTEDDRNRIMQAALDAHAVSIAHSMPQIDWSKIPGLDPVNTPGAAPGTTGAPMVTLPGKMPASNLPAAVSAINSGGSESIPMDNTVFKTLLNNFGKKK